jgi:LysM domain/L,D-transpeptidase catalytic domain
VAALAGAGLLLLGACTAARANESSTSAVPTSSPTVTEPPTTPTSAAGPATTPTTAEPTSQPTPASTTTTTTSVPPRSTTTSPSTTTPPTTTAPPRLPGVANPQCVVLIRPGDSLSLIADRVKGKKVTVARLQTENGIADPDTINAGDYLDVCVGNKIDDITGKKRVPPKPPPPPGRVTGSGVVDQQRKLNALFAGYGLPELAVDGDSGPLTEQQLCAARVALNLPISRADMVPGSAEERTLMAARSLSIPATAPASSGRWVLIDQTCQILFAGEGSNRIAFVFPTSTGESGYETRNQSGSRVFRYDPALENDGWHNSSHYPVPADNPLNGNMYRPLYFDNGQAIHGANNVPTSPASKGCARLPVASQDALVDWLGLGDVGGPVWDEDQIDLTVTVQGQY